MQSLVTVQVVWSVGWLVCHTSEHYKNSWSDRDAIWVENSGGPKVPCVSWGSTFRMGRGNFEGGKGRPTVMCRALCGRLCKYSTEMINIPFRLWARMDPRNRVLDGGPEMLRDISMATNFGTQFAITGFVWMIATRQLVVEGVWVVAWSANKMHILPITCN